VTGALTEGDVHQYDDSQTENFNAIKISRKKNLITFSNKHMCGKHFGSRIFEKVNFVSGLLIYTRGRWYQLPFQV